MPGGDWGQDVPVTGRGAPGVLIAVPSRLAPASQPASSPSPGSRYSPPDARPGSRPRGQGQCGAAGLRGAAGAPRRSPRCRAARPTAAALRDPAALGAGPPAPSANGSRYSASAGGFGGRGHGMPVGNQAPIGPPDNRSASSRPIRGGGYRSGAFGVGLQRSSRRTLGTRAASPPLRARARSLTRCSHPRARAVAAFPPGSGGATRGGKGKASGGAKEGARERRGSP